MVWVSLWGILIDVLVVHCIVVLFKLKEQYITFYFINLLCIFTLLVFITALNPSGVKCTLKSFPTLKIMHAFSDKGSGKTLLSLRFYVQNLVPRCVLWKKIAEESNLLWTSTTIKEHQRNWHFGKKKLNWKTSSILCKNLCKFEIQCLGCC